jgi:cholesterol transport system auxiliary component
MKRALIAVVLGACVAGCSLAPAPAPVAVYDFGIEPPRQTAAKVEASLALDEVSAPGALQSAAIRYRLAYRDGAQVQPYAHARWAAAPAALVQQRLRHALGASAEHGIAAAFDGVRSRFILRIELDSFVQVVESPQAARGIVRLRASLIDTAERSLRAQRVFAAEHPSPTVDASGAVRALSAATDDVIAQVVQWTARETQAAR